MNRIELRVNHELVAPLLEFIEPVLEILEKDAALALPVVDEDDDLAEIWRSGLIDTQVGDCRYLVGLFDEHFRGSGRLAIDLEKGDRILRAAAAIRLKVHEMFLAGIPDHALESGEFDFSSLNDSERTGFEAYLFFASLQEIVIRYLDGEE